VNLPNVCLRDLHVFREAAVHIDANDPHALANVALAGPALKAPPARDVHFGGDKVSLAASRDVVSDRFYDSTELVTEHQRRMKTALRPAVPTVDVQISAAHRSGRHPDQNIVSADFRHRDSPELGAGLWPRLYNGLHGR